MNAVRGKEKRFILAAIIIGGAAFWAITGGKIINPRYDSWLMKGDLATHYLSWDFFRHTPLLQFPLGANTNYGLEIGSSMVYTDSIPLMAFLLKPLNYFLPQTFQYIGAWILICFILQAFFSLKLLSIFIKDNKLLLIGSLFFAVAPPFLWRLNGHAALFAQWVILAALYLYFKDDYSVKPWVILLVLTVLINGYLLAMIAAVFLVDLLHRSLQVKIKPRLALMHLAAAMVVIVVTMWSAGYFMILDGTGAEGFGLYRMNLLSIIDPDNSVVDPIKWSKILPGQKKVRGNYEGFNYLGTGFILLLLIAAYEFVRRPAWSLNKKDFIPLALLSFGLIAYAISNRVAVGGHEVLSYPLSLFTEKITGSFRSSGRFFWPVFYLIYLGIFVFIFVRLERRLALFLCSFLLVFQIFDYSAVLSHFRNKFNSPPAWSSPMKSPFWETAARRYTRLLLVLPHNRPKDWIPLSQFAASRHLAINTGYFARVSPSALARARAELGRAVLQSQYSRDSLYIFEDDQLWSWAVIQSKPTDFAGVVDGFRVLAPGFGKGEGGRPADFYAEVAARSTFDYDLSKLFFHDKGQGSKFTLFGWSSPENWGVWSEGGESYIFLKTKVPYRKQLNLVIEGIPFVNKSHPPQKVKIFINGTLVSDLKFDSPNPFSRIIAIPGNVVAAANGKYLVHFKILDPQSPAELGLSSDGRRLGLGLISLQLNP